MELDKGKVSVNIVNWNRRKYIKRCLDAVSAQKYSGQIEVIVVDNGSIDGSREFVEQNYPWVNLVKNDSNLGFSRAHNQAIRLSKSEYVLPLNFDVLLAPNFLAGMVKAAEQDSKIGLVSGKLYKSLEGKATRLLDSTGIIMPFYFPAARGEMEHDEGQFDSTEYVYIFGPCGAAPLYRRAMLEDAKINGECFDDDFVNYVEDVDLAWRAQLMGWKAVYTPHAVAYHERGASRREDQYENGIFFRMLTGHLGSFLYSGILYLKAGFIIRAVRKLVDRAGSRTSEEERLG